MIIDKAIVGTLVTGGCMGGSTYLTFNPDYFDWINLDFLYSENAGFSWLFPASFRYSSMHENDIAIDDAVFVSIVSAASSARSAGRVQFPAWDSSKKAEIDKFLKEKKCTVVFRKNKEDPGKPIGDSSLSAEDNAFFYSFFKYGFMPDSSNNKEGEESNTGKYINKCLENRELSIYIDRDNKKILAKYYQNTSTTPETQSQE